MTNSIAASNSETPMDPVDRQLAKLQARVAHSALVVQDATLQFEHNKKSLLKLVLKKYKITQKQVDLMTALLANPLGYFDLGIQRSINSAMERQLLVKTSVPGFVLAHQYGTSPRWYELGTVGEAVMADINGPDWTYIRPKPQKIN